MMPDPAPTVQQLLAFYLEAGVDCALTEEPVNRLSDPDIVLGRSEMIPFRPVISAPAAIPAVHAEAAPAPEATIASAREAARTAPTPQGPWSGEQPLVSSFQMPGGIYAPMIHPWSSGRDLYFNLSLWSAYDVMLMHTVLP